MNFTAEINLQNKIVPLYNSDYDVLKKLKKDTPLSFEVKQPRNYQFHKKAFALLNIGFHNQEKINSFDNYRKIITMRAGFFTTEITEKGTVYFADSLSFASMDNYRFTEVYNAIVDVVAQDLGLDSDIVQKEVSNFM